MAEYKVITTGRKQYERNFYLPLINIIPAVVWSIPLHQKLFPDANGWITFLLCAAFIIVYVGLCFWGPISIVPCIASGIMLTALIWVFADMVGNNIIRIVLKIIILGIVIFVELAIFSNAMVPWLEKRNPEKPVIIRTEK